MRMRVLWLGWLFLLGLSACNALPGQQMEAQASGVVLQEDFSVPAPPWPQGETDYGLVRYENGVYRVQTYSPHTEFRALAGQSLGDVRLQLTAGKFGGPDAVRIGLICRFVDEENFYFLTITADGEYAIGRMSPQGPRFLGADGFQPAEAIVTGMAINQLQAECVGEHLRLYVNGHLLAEAQDPALTVGDVGFLVGTFAEGGADILLDDFIVEIP